MRQPHLSALLPIGLLPTLDSVHPDFCDYDFPILSAGAERRICYFMRGLIE